jgi:hypothetical protein
MRDGRVPGIQPIVLVDLPFVVGRINRLVNHCASNMPKSIMTFKEVNSTHLQMFAVNRKIISRRSQCGAKLSE